MKLQSTRGRGFCFVYGRRRLEPVDAGFVANERCFLTRPLLSQLADTHPCLGQQRLGTIEIAGVEKIGCLLSNGQNLGIVVGDPPQLFLNRGKLAGEPLQELRDFLVRDIVTRAQAHEMTDQGRPRNTLFALEQRYDRITLFEKGPLAFGQCVELFFSGRFWSFEAALNKRNHLKVDVTRPVFRLAERQMVPVNRNRARSREPWIGTVRLHDHAEDAQALGLGQDQMGNIPGIGPVPIPKIEIA